MLRKIECRLTDVPGSLGHGLDRWVIPGSRDLVFCDLSKEAETPFRSALDKTSISGACNVPSMIGWS